MGLLSSWKTALLVGSNFWDTGCTQLCNLYTYSLAVILPRRVIMRQTEYHNIAAITSLQPPPDHDSLSEPSILDCKVIGFSPNINSF
jgi:hypothetical protein